MAADGVLRHRAAHPDRPGRRRRTGAAHLVIQQTRRDGRHARPTRHPHRPSRAGGRHRHRLQRYNTTLLCYCLGESNVCSIDIHPGLIEAAREHLAEIGHRPRLATGDGAAGWVERAPFDRIIPTCAITRIPPEWIRQLADGGRIVAPLDAGNAGPLLVLDKTAPDEVTGRIDPYPARFMPLREHADSP